MGPHTFFHPNTARIFAFLCATLAFPNQALGRPPALESRAAQELLSLEKLFHPARQKNYFGTPASYAWMPEGSLLINNRGSMTRVPLQGRASQIFKDTKLSQVLTKAGFKAEFAKRVLESGRFTLAPSQDFFLLEIKKDFYKIAIQPISCTRLTYDQTLKGVPQFSPDEKKIAYIKKNDLYVLDLMTKKEKRLTAGGSEINLNGVLDWVYEEEIYGRGNKNAFWWSPDSRQIAFLNLDISHIPTYTLVDDRQSQKRIATRYPRAGEAPGVAQLGVIDLAGKVTWFPDPFPSQETLLVRVGWDRGGRIYAAYQNRLQNWLELRILEGNTSRTLVRESSQAWQDRLDAPCFLQDGSLLWLSDRTGFRHLYHLQSDGQVIRQITSGEWDVRELHGINEQAGQIYFSGTQRSSIGLDAYAIPLPGKKPNENLRRLTEAPGYHAVLFNPQLNAFLDRCGDIHTPMQIEMRSSDGKLLHKLEDLSTAAFRSLKLGQIKFQQVPTRDGFPMETLLVLPPDFTPAGKYPVYQEIYGGPQLPLVRNARPNLWHHFLASQGFVVWICDNRSASNKGVASAYPIYKKLGQLELQDQLDGLAWLKQQGFADMNQVFLDGWSYGGFLAGYAMCHSNAWKAAILGAPVTDFRLYDSVYTERYLGFPSQNKEGYLNTDLSRNANRIQGPLMIFHGALDDNVLPQNTIRFVDALQKAGKDHELVLLPGSGHGPRSPEQIWFRYFKTWNFLKSQAKRQE